MKDKISKICYTIAIILLIILIGGVVFGAYKKQTLKTENPIVTMEVQNFGTIKIELYPEIAPETVKNFIALIKNELYDGLTFHRVVKDFMIQGGDIEGDGTGSPTIGDLYNNYDEGTEYKYTDGTTATSEDKYGIKGEFVANGYKNNNLNLTEGVIAMARNDYTAYSATLSEESYNSASSQFFIMTSNEHTNLSGYYAGFGKVIEGMDVVKNIANVECKVAGSEDESAEDLENVENEENTEDTENEGEENSEESEDSQEEKSTPVEEVKILQISVDTKGVDYGMPEIIKPFDYTKWLNDLYGITTTQTIEE